MELARAVIDRLGANGIDTVFGIPGKQTLPLNEAIGNTDGIRFVVARHETAVTHQAWGYAETSDVEEAIGDGRYEPESHPPPEDVRGYRRRS